MRMRYLAEILAGLLIGTCDVAVAVVPTNTADAFTDFSGTNNPNGAWSYGYRFRDDSVASGWGTFSPMMAPCNEPPAPGYSAWERDLFCAFYNLPMIIKNGTGADSIYFDTVLLPGSVYLSLHPGPSGEGADVKWSAPSRGAYQINVRLHESSAF